MEELKHLAFNLYDYIDQNELLQFATLAIAFNPLFWNIVARLEHKTHFLTKITGSPYRGCYLLAATIFSLGIFRDHVYYAALAEQPTYQPLLDIWWIRVLAVVCFVFGNVLVLSSMWALGITGTYLGDYFGILMDERVTSFPFNVNDNPMYNGLTLCFLGTALWYGKPAGLAISVIVFGMYKIALFFEEPYTAAIYAKREADKKTQ